jgi:SpoVK/Ycf46/Vps4 family AAA+-type ATPase
MNDSTEERVGIFEEVKEFPDPSAARRFAGLVGLDEKKERLLKEARLLLDPDSLTHWSEQFYHKKTKIIKLFEDRPPLFIFAGDVGTGKTALAETFGDAVARETGLSMTLYALSLNARGKGAVGEMTSLLSMAFTEVRQAASRASGRGGKRTSGIVLLVDEADALAQSRELAQMHHEDRAGVNALIRGVDDLATGNLPAIIVMCTNRLEALDPAIRRRAAATFIFERPNEDQRRAVVKPVLEELGFTSHQIESIVTATGACQGRSYGYTYSDLTQRFLPGLFLAAYPARKASYDLAKKVIEEHPPTPPFQEASSD